MNYPLYSDEFFMKEALKEAQMAFEKDEIPIGAVVVSGDRIIGRGHNMTEELQDVTAHAELLAITAAENYLGSKFLNDCRIYVSIEPCVMCAGAINLSRISFLCYGASEPKYGFSNFSKEILSSKIFVVPGILANEAASLMKEYFSTKRSHK